MTVDDDDDDNNNIMRQLFVCSLLSGKAQNKLEVYNANDYWKSREGNGSG